MGNAIVDLYRRYTSGWTDHDVEALLSCWNEGGVHEDVSLGEIYTGLAEVRAFYEKGLVALPDLTLEPGPCFLSGEDFCGEWTLSGTRTSSVSAVGESASNRPYRIRGLSNGRVVDGKFSAMHDYYNMLELAKQLGMLPPPAGSTPD